MSIYTTQTRGNTFTVKSTLHAINVKHWLWFSNSTISLIISNMVKFKYSRGTIRLSWWIDALRAKLVNGIRQWNVLTASFYNWWVWYRSLISFQEQQIHFSLRLFKLSNMLCLAEMPNLPSFLNIIAIWQYAEYLLLFILIFCPHPLSPTGWLLSLCTCEPHHPVHMVTPLLPVPNIHVQTVDTFGRETPVFCFSLLVP